MVNKKTEFKEDRIKEVVFLLESIKKEMKNMIPEKRVAYFSTLMNFFCIDNGLGHYELLGVIDVISSRISNDMINKIETHEENIRGKIASREYIG